MRQQDPLFEIVEQQGQAAECVKPLPASCVSRYGANSKRPPLGATLLIHIKSAGSRLCERGASVALTVPRHHGVGCEANGADCLHLFYTYSRYFFTDLASASLLSTDRIDYCTGGSMDIVWLALLGALFLLLIGLTVGCDRLIPRRK